MTEDSVLPFIEYYKEDKSKYTTATQKGYHDPDNDFLVGDSGGFLFNVDFIFVNTHLLRPAANHWEKYGSYTDYPDDSPPHRRFRVQEENRRKTGFVAKCKLPYKDVDLYRTLKEAGKDDLAEQLVKPLRITGEHYNFINYGSIRKLDESSVIVGENGMVTGSKHEGIPIFFGSQYWWYKSKEFAKHNGFHLIVGKARRAGFSYMEAIGSANTINLDYFSTVIHAASDLTYITKGRSITPMSLIQIEHYETETPFKRGIISRDIEDIFLGYKDKQNRNKGRRSHLLSLTTGNNNPEIAVGKDAIEIKCEELSTFDNFDDFMTVTEPTTRTGSVTTGLITAWGTGGTKNGKWEIFEANFYNPSGFNFMPFENIWDKDSRNEVCGFYKPYVESLQGFLADGKAALDADGNTNYEIAMEISRIERIAAKKKAKTIAEYITYCGQYANMPSESFSSTTDNMFASEILTNHINHVKHNPDYKFYQDGQIVEVGNTLKFKSNFKLHDEGVKVHEYLSDVPPIPKGDPHGCFRIWHFPFRDPLTGMVPDIYSFSYDPIGKDKDDPNNRNSYNSITVWMNPNKYFPRVGKLRVANFFGRPHLMEEADRIARNIVMFYGGHKNSLLVEITRGETRSNFKKWGCTNLLSKEPVVVWDNKIKETSVKSYGIDISNDIRKLQGLELLKAMLYHKVGVDQNGNDIVFLQTIPDIAFLSELQKWNNDGNYDRVSDAIVEAFNHKRMEVYASIKLQRRHKLEEETVMTRDWY